MKMTMEDVARTSGVSKATVSYVLNQKSSSLGLSSQTIMKVLDASRKLNYRPDLVAVALSKQKSVPLSVLILSPWLHSQFSDFMAQVSRTLERMSRETRMKLAYELYREGELSKILKPARCAKCDAVLVLGSTREDNAFLKKNCGLFKNVVLLNRLVDGYPCSCSNDAESCMEMARRISGRGYYRKYVVVCGAVPTVCEEKRVAGFLGGLKKSDTDISLVKMDSSLTPEKQVMELSERFGGEERVLFFLPQYHPAALLLRLLQKYGVSVPEKAGIVCYDRHSLLSDFISPELTTIDPDIDSMTRHAMHLAAEIKSGKVPRSIVAKGVLVTGGSAIL